MYKETTYIINLRNAIHSGVLVIVIMGQDVNFLILKFKRMSNSYQYVPNHLCKLMEILLVVGYLHCFIE